MAITDEDDFDATEAALQKIRTSPAGALALDTIVQKAKLAAEEIFAAWGPVVLEAGRVAIPVLEGFAVTALQAELGKLSR